MYHSIGKRQALINSRDGIVHDDLGLFTQRTQDLAAGKSRPDGIAIRPGMRRQHEMLTRLNMFKHLLQHGRALLCEISVAGPAFFSYVAKAH